MKRECRSNAERGRRCPGAPRPFPGSRSDTERAGGSPAAASGWRQPGPAGSARSRATPPLPACGPRPRCVIRCCTAGFKHLHTPPLQSAGCAAPPPRYRQTGTRAQGRKLLRRRGCPRLSAFPRRRGFLALPRRRRPRQRARWRHSVRVARGGGSGGGGGGGPVLRGGGGDASAWGHRGGNPKKDSAAGPDHSVLQGEERLWRGRLGEGAAW